MQLRSRALFIFGLVVMASFFSFIPLPAFAVSSPAPDTVISYSCANASSCNNAVTTTGANEEIVIWVLTTAQGQAGGCTGPTSTAATVTVSGLSLTWINRGNVKTCYNSQAPYYSARLTEYAAFTSSKLTAATVTVTASNSSYAILEFFTTYTGVYTGGPQVDATPCTGAGLGTTGSCTLSTNNPDDIILGFLIGLPQTGGGNSCPFTAGAGYTLFTGSSCASVSQGPGAGQPEYKQVSSVQASLLVSETSTAVGTNGWLMFGDALTADAGITVIPCNFFQFQCWMYPLLMMSLVVGTIFFAVAPSRPSKEAIAYILLSSLTFTSAVEVLMGLLPITMPLLLTVILAAYTWRFR